MSHHFNHYTKDCYRNLMEYDPARKFFTFYQEHPTTKVLERVLSNEYLSVEEKEKRVLIGLEEVRPSEEMYTKSFFTAPRVFQKLYSLDIDLADVVIDEPFYSRDREILKCAEISVFSCLEKDEAFAVCERITRGLLRIACEKEINRDEREDIWTFARKYYDPVYLRLLENSSNKKWIDNKLKR